MEHGKSTLVSLSPSFQNVLSSEYKIHRQRNTAMTVSRQLWAAAVITSLFSRHFESRLIVLTATYVCFPPFCNVAVTAFTCFPHFASCGRHTSYLFCHHFTSLCSTTITSSSIFPVENSAWNKEWPLKTLVHSIRKVF